MIEAPRRTRPAIATLTTLLIALLPACRNAAPFPDLPIAHVTIEAGRNTLTMRVSVADTPEARGRGLMGVEDLHETGMLFKRDEVGEGTFWMKDTLIPLTLAVWGPEGQIEAILDMEPCRADPCKIYDPGVPWQFALEVEQGFFAEHGVAVGNPVRIDEEP